MLVISTISYTIKQSRGKTFVVFTVFAQSQSFPVEYFTRLGIHYYKKLLPQKFSRRIFIFVLTVKVFPLEYFVVYGTTYIHILLYR